MCLANVNESVHWRNKWPTTNNWEKGEEDEKEEEENCFDTKLSIFRIVSC